MALKACTVTAELSRDMLAADDGDKKVAERALDCYLQQAVVWYVGLADTNDKMKQRKQVGEVLRLLGEVRVSIMMLESLDLMLSFRLPVLI